MTRILSCLLSCALPLLTAGADAALLVTTLADSVANDGTCSLREAITAANTNLASGAAAGECGVGQTPPFDRIDLPAGSFRLTRTGAVDDSNAAGDLDVRRAGIEIVGAGADLTEIRGDRKERVIDVAAGLSPPLPGAAPVVLRGLSLRNGSDGEGGGIRTAAGWALTIDACGIANNSADRGGGISAAGTLTVQASTFHGNVATAVTGPGGGGLHYSGTTPALLRNVTLNANESATDGAAAVFTGPAQLNNVTAAGNISDNDMDDTGDGAIAAFAAVEMANTLLAANIDFSILIGGSVSPDCVGSAANLTSRGYNLVANTGAACLITAQAGDQFGTSVQPINARLLPFGLYGGTTETQLPAATSPAVDTGAPAGAPVPCESVDQRGTARPIGLRCDIGAVESDDRIFADGFGI
ncbi:MAG: hypothetical protein AMXMBFR59_38990 [Rhodanobacteraceae bacterium]